MSRRYLLEKDSIDMKNVLYIFKYCKHRYFFSRHFYVVGTVEK